MRDREHQIADFRNIIDEPRKELSTLCIVEKGIAHAQKMPEKFFAHGEFDFCAHAAPDDFDFIIEEIICRVDSQKCASRQNHFLRYTVRQKFVHQAANQHRREQSQSRADKRADHHERKNFFVRRINFRKKIQPVLDHLRSLQTAICN